MKWASTRFLRPPVNIMYLSILSACMPDSSQPMLDWPGIANHSVRLNEQVISQKHSTSENAIPSSRNSPIQGSSCPSSYSWPVSGPIAQQYGPGAAGAINRGIDIAVQHGAAVRASESGKVIYAGNELKSYGNLVVISHCKEAATVYAYIARLAIAPGESVAKGQIIGFAGSASDGKLWNIHIEFRMGNTTVDPVAILKR